MPESSNRAFLYGESVFTTMRMLNGRVCDWEYHFERLSKGIEFVYGPFKDGDDWLGHLKNRLENKWQGESGNRVLRLAAYSDQGRGVKRLSLMSVMDLKVSLISTPLDVSRFEGKALKLRTCAASQKPHWWPSYLKVGNYLETILAQKIFLRPGDDDLLFLSNDDTVLESSVANIFVVRHNKLYTAPPGPNVLDGVMRKKIIDSASDFFEDCIESETTIEQLLKADAVFGTNSVRGPFLIDRIDEHDLTYDENFLSKFDSLKRKVYG
jgi:branched-subunit amino acid aminotransferase/4-amino-4-deoxychorismate lyase